MTGHPETMSASMDVPHSQNSAPVLEFRCLYTADIRRKQKRWQDGKLKFHTFNKRVMVYDEKSNFVGDTHWKGGLAFDEGEELELERGGILVEVGECIGKRDQDLTELVDKRVKDREEREAAKVAHATPSASFLRNQGTPAGSALLRPKPLNAMLTATGHYGRAVIPNISPFEERQAANRDENEPPAKRRKQNDTTSSKNGYAQNLMGATLSLGSSKPSSTPTIRYEPFRARPVQQSRVDAIDLTMDDEEERRASDARRKIAREHRAAIERPPPKQKRQKKSPPAKSGYASNLTGTPLMLSRSEPRPPVRNTMAKALVQQPGLDDESSESEHRLLDSEPAPKRSSHVAKRPVAVQPRHQHVEQSPSEGEDSSIEIEPTPRRASHTTQEPVTGRSTHHDIGQSSSSEEDSSVDIEPPPKVATKIARKPKVATYQARSQAGQDSFTEKEDSFVDIEFSPMTVSTKAAQKAKRPIAPSRHSQDSSSAIETEPSQRPVKIQKKQKEAPATKAAKVPKVNPSFQARPSSPPRIENAAPRLQRGGSFNKSAAQKSSAVEPTPDRSMSALRIKSRPRQKMMMLMNRPSSRPSTSNTSFDGSRSTAYPPSEPTAALNEVDLSQATIKLNIFCEKQKAELEARLNRIGSKPHLGDISSSDPDSGIDHETIDLLLTCKPMPLQNLAEQVRVSPKPSFVDKPPAVNLAGKEPMASYEATSSTEIDGSSRSKESLSSVKAASAETQGYEQNHRPSKPSSSIRKPLDLKFNGLPPAAASHDGEEISSTSQSRLEVTIAAPDITEKGSKELTAEDTSKRTNPMIALGRPGGESPPSTAMQRPPPEIDRAEEIVTAGMPPEEPKATDPEVLKEPTIQDVSTEIRPSTRNHESPIGNVPSDDETEACPAPIKPPGQPKEQPPISRTTIEVLELVGGIMQSSTSRFRAMINPSSSARNSPPRIASPVIESTISHSLKPFEGGPGPSEAAVKHLPKSLPPAAEALNDMPEPCSDPGFRTAVTSAALSIPDLAGNVSRVGPPRAKLANPATRGKSLQTLAASTVDTMNPLFNPMAPPAPRISSRVEQNLGRDENDVDRASEGPLREAPTSGPWSREAFDLFGLHGPPRVGTGPGIPAI